MDLDNEWQEFLLDNNDNNNNNNNNNNNIANNDESFKKFLKQVNYIYLQKQKLFI